MNSTTEVLKPTEQFFSNTENDPMSPRLMLFNKLIGLGYGFRIDPVAHEAVGFGGNGSIMPDHVAVYASRNVSDIWYDIARDPEFNVLTYAYDALKYSHSPEPEMHHCDWSDETKRKVSAWAMNNTAVRLKTTAATVNTNPLYGNYSQEEKNQVRNRFKQEAEEGIKLSQQVLGTLTPLTIDELDYLVEKSVRQTLMPSI